MSKKRQREIIDPRARHLAESGHFLNWYEIEVELRHGQGLSEARHVLDNERTRKELNRLCAEARRAMPNA